MMKRLTVIAGGVALLLSACGGKPPTQPANPPGDACTKLGSERPVTVLVTDVSGSTKDLRTAGGEFEHDWLLAARCTALHQGRLWATTADSQTLSDSVWQVNGQEFKPTIEDNDLLATAEMNKKAEALEPEARKIVGVTKPSRSDLLGALQVSSRLFRNHGDEPRALVFLTDGGINVGKRDLGFDPPRTDAGRQKLIDELKKTGELPDLTGGQGKPVRVWMGGLGHGVGGGDPRKTQAVIELWRALIPAAGGELVADDSTLRLPDFP